MLVLFIGIFSGFLACFFSEQALTTVADYRRQTSFNRALKAAMGQWVVQVLWIAIAIASLFLINEYVVVKKSINSLHGLDRGFSMLAALILVFAAYRTIRGRALSISIMQKERAFFEIAKLALNQPIRILIYLSFFSILGIHWVIVQPIQLIILFLSTLFGVFLGWSVFCSNEAVARWTDKEIKKLLDMTAYFVLALTVVGLFVVAV